MLPPVLAYHAPSYRLGCVTGLARPSVRPSVRPVYGLVTREQEDMQVHDVQTGTDSGLVIASRQHLITGKMPV